MRWFVVGAVAVLVFDALSAWASVAFGMEYGHPIGLAVSTFLYAMPSFLAAQHRHRVRAGTTTGAAVAGFDATVGWAVSSGIGATSLPTDAVSFLLVAALVVGVGALAGTLAGALAIRVTDRSAGKS